MSYNINSVDTPVFDAWMYAKDIVKVHKEYADEFPEITFLEDLVGPATDLLLEGNGKAHVKLETFWWSGEGSGDSFELLSETVAPLIHGRVDAIFTWEGGNSHSGLRIEDGVVTECDVTMALVPRDKKP